MQGAGRKHPPPGSGTVHAGAGGAVRAQGGAQRNAGSDPPAPRGTRAKAPLTRLQPCIAPRSPRTRAGALDPGGGAVEPPRRAEGACRGQSAPWPGGPRGGGAMQMRPWEGPRRPRPPAANSRGSAGYMRSSFVLASGVCGGEALHGLCRKREESQTASQLNLASTGVLGVTYFLMMPEASTSKSTEEYAEQSTRCQKSNTIVRGKLLLEIIFLR